MKKLKTRTDLLIKNFSLIIILVISLIVAGLREGGAFLLTRCKYNKVFNKDKT